jgi:hypothetical protein
MTIHFAAAIHNAGSRRLSRSQARATLAFPANDNDFAAESDKMLHAALRQFARHGIGAAAHARGQAERAFFMGDRDTYQWWLGICRALDRRLAANLIKNSDREKA